MNEQPIVSWKAAVNVIYGEDMAKTIGLHVRWFLQDN